MGNVIDTGFHKEYDVLHVFAGIGGGALGFQKAMTGYKGLSGRFKTLCGIDVDQDACKDFEMLTGAQAVRMDLFSREQYTDFHGALPPEGWREVTAMDILCATGNRYPHVVFLSPPCKGFSSLLSAKSAESTKYQALNKLAVRSIRLVLEAFSSNLPSTILLENVPRIASSRGAALLKEIKSLLTEHGYLFHEGYHDCGEIGGLGQRRKRYLLIARHKEKMPTFIYYPRKLRVRSIGEIIGPIPMPDAQKSGPMHRLPRLQWKTWVRLALIPAGGDWRDLEEFAAKDGYSNKYQIIPWGKYSSCVTGMTDVQEGAPSVSDPRLDYTPRKSTFGVQHWTEPSTTVTGNMQPGGSSPTSIADPRVDTNGPKFNHAFKIVKWGVPAATVASGGV